MTTNITIPLALLEQLVGALEVSKRWHNGDKYRYGKPQQRQAWTAQSGELDTAITAGRAALEGAELAEPMIEVADRYAHRLALELECVLADRPGYYDKAMQVLGEYRSAMNAIHERHSPTFMGEPLIHADHHGPDWTQRDGEYLK